MTTQIDHAAKGSTAPPSWEAVRTVASIVIALAVVTIAAGTTVFEGAPTHPTIHPSLLPSQAPAPILSDPQPPVTAVFYLVHTPEQASLADSGESDRISEASYRQYQILYARDDQELRLAGEFILESVLAYDSTPSIQVIDLRSVRTPDQ